MVEFNILQESFITNDDSVVSGALLELDAEEVSSLISTSGGTVTVSGYGVLSLLLDLGTQKSVDRLDYGFSPISVSGLVIQYGRDLDHLTIGAMSQVGQKIRVEPTISGYDYPRYFKIEQVVTSGTSITLASIEVINDDGDVNFGQDGLLQSFHLTGGAFAAPSEVYGHVRVRRHR